MLKLKVTKLKHVQRIYFIKKKRKKITNIIKLVKGKRNTMYVGNVAFQIFNAYKILNVKSVQR